MKDQLQEKIKEINYYRFMMDEYKAVADQETAKATQYKSLMQLAQETFKSSLFQSNNNQEMQNLIAQLTVVLTERDEQLGLEKTLNRQLRQSLDEVTRNQ